MTLLDVSTKSDATWTLPPSHTVIIPIANPDSAALLLKLAERLLGGENGHIVLLYVVTEDRDSNAAEMAAFHSIIQVTNQETTRFSIELKIHPASDVVDGILEVAGDYDAQLILLGLSYSVRGQVELGNIVEGVIDRAACDVGVYRSPRNSSVERIVVPVGGSIASRVILKIGRRLSDGYNLPCELLHVYNGSPEEEVRRHAQDLLAAVPGQKKVNINLIHGINEARSVLSWTNEKDLMVIGFSERNALEKWLYGDTAQRILDRARGPVLMVSRAIDNAEI